MGGCLGGRRLWFEVSRRTAQAELTRTWPRASKLLKGLAESHESDARREDQEAERRHQGLE
ncbi:hypothetical protein GCM10010306_049580 [Streptomyces umbrinus]|nr:hypothetical protein GCM10010306_049580 [Streptomyces umbrinus]GHH34722.1 hypothetical protein GCM10018775_07790 [Streptomyces umbrinus]